MRLTAKDIALISVMVALLIGGQFIFSFINGVEAVTVLLLCFCYCFGAKRGVFVATAFSLLRCFLWGFYPAVIILYLLYYNIFALIFGAIGEHQRRQTDKKNTLIGVVFTEFLFLLLFVLCVLFITQNIPISVLLSNGLKTLSWLILSFSGTLFLLYNLSFFFKKGSIGAKLQQLTLITVTAAFCTVCFSLLDDVITPLFFGYTPQAALAYFYASFSAIIPQTLCTVVTVTLFFFPLIKIFEREAKSIVK